MTKTKPVRYPYAWYVYKNDQLDQCPECGSLPIEYEVKSSHWALRLPVIFTCPYSHKYEEQVKERHNQDDKD